VKWPKEVCHLHQKVIYEVLQLNNGTDVLVQQLAALVSWCMLDQMSIGSFHAKSPNMVCVFVLDVHDTLCCSN
jgi:hypothetical protein